jgi:TRAP-type C4-dicarboxylate transport system substrate-binding protein
MKMTRKLWKDKVMGTVMMGLLGVFIGMMPWCIMTPAWAASAVTLTGETFTPTMSPPARLIGPEFNKGLENATGGLVKTTWHTASALGPIAEVYTRLVTRVIDYGQFNIGYTPGVFPMSEMLELPIRFPSAEMLTRVMIEMYKKGYFDKDYSDVKFLFFYNIGPYQLWSTAKIASVEDLKGKKLRCPSPTFVDVTKAVGAIPVSMVGGEIYSAMEKRIIDGTWACGDMAAAFKVAEVAKYVAMTDIGTVTHSWAMNKIPYQALPESGKKYIADNWEKFSLMGGRLFDEYNEKGFAFARQNKVETIMWSDAELKKMDKIIAPVFGTWVARVEAKGLPGKKALSDFHRILEQMGSKAPFVLPQ